MVLMGVFQRLPNLIEVIIDCNKSDIFETDQGSKTTTRLFSMVAASLTYASATIERLSLEFSDRAFDPDNGVSTQALVLPRNVLKCFSNLQTLDLLLETRDGSYYSMCLL